MTSIKDSYLLFRLRTKRDPEAFAQIYDRYAKAIFRFVALKVPTREIAEDITAETFTKAWQYVSQKAHVLQIRALLYKIARNTIVDYYRKDEPVLSIDTVTFPDESTSSYTASDIGHGATRIQANADVALAIEQLQKLKDDYRDVLTLRLIDELPFSEIAEIMEKTVGNVRVIYHRAMKSLEDNQNNNE